jgi:hypothetical protein
MTKYQFILLLGYIFKETGSRDRIKIFGRKWIVPVVNKYLFWSVEHDRVVEEREWGERGKEMEENSCERGGEGERGGGIGEEWGGTASAEAVQVGFGKEGGGVESFE